MSEQFLTETNGSIPANIEALPSTRVGQYAKNAVDFNTRALLVQSAPGSGGGGGAYVDRSGTITSGGVAQAVAAANASRRYFIFQNVSDTAMWLGFGVNATASQPNIYIAAGGYFEPLVAPTTSVTVYGATTGKAFTCKEA